MHGKKGMLTAAAVVTVALLLVGIIGCHGERRGSEMRVADPLSGQTDDLDLGAEVDLVEQMAQLRARYEQTLQVLFEFYDQQGNHLKAGWVEEEMEYLGTGPQRQYLVVAEVAGANLRAQKTIPEADVLYEEGLALKRRGRGILGLLGSKKNLYLSIDKFNELITTYSDSDRIGEAAFEIAEIYRLHLKDYARALQYYQRVRQWDPLTSRPVSYAMARIYDDHLHNRVKAVYYYEEAINLDMGQEANAAYAQKRIVQINKEITGGIGQL